MQFIRTENLKAGMRLAKPIYNKNGILLYDRNIKLTLPVINSVENFGLIGLYILEPAEPLPPLSREDIEFEQNQTIYMFKLRTCLDAIRKGHLPADFTALCQDIKRNYGNLNHLINFTQNLRSSDDFMFKHSINTAILIAMLCHVLGCTNEEMDCMISAALLYDIGYEFVPKEIMDKSKLTDEDIDQIQLALEKGFEVLSQNVGKTELPPKAMTLIEYYIFRNSKSRPITKAGDSFILMANVLSVAGQYDQLTAMNISHTPVSEIIAMQVLLSNPDKFPTDIVKALADCIHIVPAGASVDLSNRTKGIVLVENEDEFMKPLILCIENNMIYDLSDPAVYKTMQITDIMKTMDNRIAIDENTLKLFKGDKRLSETTNKFKKAAANRRQAQQQKAKEPTMTREEEVAALEKPKANPLASSAPVNYDTASVDDILHEVELLAKDLPLQNGEPAPSSAPKKKKRKLM